MVRNAARIETEEVTKLLKERISELKKLVDKQVFNNSVTFHYNFRKWRSETKYALSRFFDENSKELEGFREAITLPSVEGTPVQLRQYRLRVMAKAAGELEALVSSIERYGISGKHQTAAAPKAFIAHGGKSAARDKLQDFLIALGVTPIIVEEQPSEGRSKDKNVEYYLKQYDCAIILATKGDVDGRTGEFIPRGNILVEIGRCQEILPDRMVYLLEEGAKFPTDIDEKVWERFTKESMDKAFIKIAKELRAFGLIRPIKPAG